MLGHDKNKGYSFVLLLVVAVFLVAPIVGVYPTFLMNLMCFAMFACAFNLLLGVGGLLSFGHAMFFGSGSYMAAHAAKVWGFTPELAVMSAVVGAVGLGWLTGVLAIRRAGIYFSMITLAFAQMVYFLCLQMPFTHGEDGIQAVPRGYLFGMFDLSNEVTIYCFVLFLFLASFSLIFRIVHSPFGEALTAIRENEQRAISLGYDVGRIKLQAFVLSAGLSGLAGGTKAILFQMASLTDVHWMMSGEVVLMTLIGGMGTIVGPVVGAGLVVTMQNYFAEVGSWVTVIQGAFFIGCVLIFRQGIAGILSRTIKRLL